MTQKLFLLVLLLTAMLTTHAQHIGMRANAVAFRAFSDRLRGWTEWSDWEPTSLYISVDLYNDRVTIYSRTRQQYRIVSMSHQKTSGGIERFTMECVNRQGRRCELEQLIRPNGKSELYIRFSHVQWVYAVSVEDVEDEEED